MKNLFAALKSAPKRSAALAMVLGAVLVPAALFAWGPDRPTYTIEHPADHVTFNSITNNPNYGDEREFVTIKDMTTGGSLTNNATLVPGHTYKVQMYVHNDASETLNTAENNYKGIARNTTVRAVLPASVEGNDTVDGFVSASNATPGTVYDTAALKSNGRVNLEFVSGSAMLHTAKQQTKLSDNIIGANGVAVGSGDAAGTDLSGNWNGCIHYAGAVTYEFKVSQPAAPNFTVEKMVSKSGANTWSENYAAKPGDKVDFRIKYANTGNTTQNNVVVKDTLPAGLSYVAGTTRLYSSQTPAEGKLLSDNVTKDGVNIGAYAANAWAYVAFTATVSGNDQLPVCGKNTLTNTASVETDNGGKSDTATVTVDKTCETPKKPGVSITKTVDNVKDKEVQVNKNFEYQLVVKNTGDQDLTNVKVSDKAPAGVTLLSADKGTVANGNAWNYTIPSLKVGQSMTFKLQAIVKTYIDGKLVNTACVNAQEVNPSEPSKEDGCDTATIHVPKPPVPVEKVTVCDTATGKTVDVYPSQIDNTRYTKDMSKCEEVVTPETPETPKTPEQPVVTQLPVTGSSDVVMPLFGLGSLIAAVSYYIASRRALNL